MYILLGQKQAAADGQVVGHFGLLPAFNYMAILNYQQLTYLVKRIHWQQAHPRYPKFFNNFLCNSCFTTSATTTYTWQWTNKVSGWRPVLICTSSQKQREVLLYVKMYKGFLRNTHYLWLIHEISDDKRQLPQTVMLNMKSTTIFLP